MVSRNRRDASPCKKNNTAGEGEILDRSLASGHLLWLLGSLCTRYRIPFDAALLAQQFPPPHQRASFHQAAQALGIKTGVRNLAGFDRLKLPLPAIAFLRGETANADDASAAAESPATPVLVVKRDGDSLVYFRPGSQAPETLALDQAASRLEAELIVVARESPAADLDGEEFSGLAAATKPFGFRWFVPELLKHRRIWRDVLLASPAASASASRSPAPCSSGPGC
ncbi:MAG: hypothetical protein Q8S20_20370 [Sulfuritalea sp.]|nr:hypothetical protein [Sulfuritalea sp.]